MKLIIDIPEDLFKRTVFYREFRDLNDCVTTIKALEKAVPLPKRMLSVDLIIETLCQKDEDYDYPCIAPSYLEEELERLLLDVAPTIIETDKENKQ